MLLFNLNANRLLHIAGQVILLTWGEVFRGGLGAGFFFALFFSFLACYPRTHAYSA